MRRWLKRIGLGLAVLVALVLLVLLVLAGGALWLGGKLSASLPLLDGELRLAGLAARVTVERDDLGIPTIRGANREDVARATGFVHAQDRFFQMDLLRRSAAGELAALIGPVIVEVDRRNRLHRFRDHAQKTLPRIARESRAVVSAYAEGVNAGLAALDAAPPEYLALRTEPEPWLPEDTILVVLAMYFDLQDEQGRRESNLGLMYDLLPRELADFIATVGTEWDAPLAGDPLATPPVPGADVYDVRPAGRAPAQAEAAQPHPGSNNWAVAGTHTADGGALLANDMHLGHGLPNIWYRVSFAWPAGEGGEWRVTGVTLPGAPTMIVGSNGRVAWGFTNSYADLSDLVIVEPDPADDDLYLTPEGPRRYDHHDERIEIKDADDEILPVEWTVWGPVIDRDHRGRRRAIRWIAHDLGAVDLGLLKMETARDLDEALEMAAATGIPTQNCVVADSTGRIGWTLMGPLPLRVGFTGSIPRSWATGEVRWDGHLPPEARPRIGDPPDGRLWSANNRLVGGEALERIGDGGYALGARARQIRDGLLAIEWATAEEMLAVQLDDRALFLERWRGLLLDTLSPDALEAEPRRAELRELIEDDWTGRASIDSAGYRLVRAFRLFVSGAVFESITAPCKSADERFSARLPQWEGPLWALVTQRPRHLLDSEHESWDALLLAEVDAVIERFAGEEGAVLAEATWGALNTVRVQHPLSRAVPQLSRWLDVPPEPLPGDTRMPRVQSPRFGASMRMVVSPGREADGLFHMPGGQSGHPRSPYYRKGHQSWSSGEPTPFLPGNPTHTLTLTP